MFAEWTKVALNKTNISLSLVYRINYSVDGLILLHKTCQRIEKKSTTGATWDRNTFINKSIFHYVPFLTTLLNTFHEIYDHTACLKLSVLPHRLTNILGTVHLKIFLSNNISS